MANRSDIESKIYKIVGYQFNLLSNKQLIKALYEDAGIPVIEKTSAGNPSTTEATLKKLAEDYELAALVLEFKKEMKKSSGIKEEPKKSPKPGMPQERQVLSRTNIVDELNRDPEDILREEESKEQSRKNDAAGSSDSNSAPGAQSASQMFTLKPLPEKKPESSDSVPADPLMEGVFGSGASGGDVHEVTQTPVTVSVAMEIPDDVPVGTESFESADSGNSQANSEEPKPEENAHDEEKKVVSFGMSSSFSLSKDQENVHNAIHEKEQGKSGPQRKKSYSLDDEEEQENEFSRNSATLNVKKRVVEDTRQEEKSKVGLVIMILVAVLAVVVVGIGVNSIMQIG